MKLAKITTLYSTYIDYFYSSHPNLASQPYGIQKAALDYDASGWADFWSHALAPLGYEMLEVSYNVEPLQRMWAKEKSISSYDKIDLKKIAIEQIRDFKPDILWFDDSDEKLLSEIKVVIPSIRLVLGWTGSAIPHSDHWKHVDLVLSCAQESVNILQTSGVRAEQLHHGFDPRVATRLVRRDKTHDFTFIGQIVRHSQFHLQREEMLLKLAKLTDIKVYSASARLDSVDDIKSALAAFIHGGLSIFRRLGVSEKKLSSLPRIGWLATCAAPPLRAVNPKLRPYLLADVYGLQMFQILADSKVVLNIHADSSPRFASNMKLFETTGVGSCLLTDWRENLSELFDVDREIVTYRNWQDCVEKVLWLQEHPRECEEIARAGKLKVLNCHTYANRSQQLDKIIRKLI